MAHRDDNNLAGIPTLDIQSFIGGDDADKRAFASQLGEAYETIGFAAIHGHGIPDELIAQLYAESESFFALPTDMKRRYARPETNNQRGFVSMGIEHAKDSDAADLKEFWQVGQPHPPVEHDPSHFPSNESVAERPEFQATAVRTFEALEELGQTVLRAIALHLGVQENYFEPWVKGGNSILRAIHYPPITSEPDTAVRAGQHEDINLITLLVGASASGLEVLRNDNTWIPITALPEHRCERGRHVAAFDESPAQIYHASGGESAALRMGQAPILHAVFLPSSARHAPRRHAAFGSLWEEPKDAPISAGEYLDQRLREIGLAK